MTWLTIIRSRIAQGVALALAILAAVAAYGRKRHGDGLAQAQAKATAEAAKRKEAIHEAIDTANHDPDWRRLLKERK
jgi:hypothetical protein